MQKIKCWDHEIQNWPLDRKTWLQQGAGKRYNIAHKRKVNQLQWKPRTKIFSVFLRVFTQKRQHHEHSRFSVVRSALKQQMMDGKYVAVMYELLRAYFQVSNVLFNRCLGAVKDFKRCEKSCCAVAPHDLALFQEKITCTRLLVSIGK